LLTVPHVVLPHVGGVQATQSPLLHVVFVAWQDPQGTEALPQLLMTFPQLIPASVMHSGGCWVHTPLMHCWPLGQAGHVIVSPQLSPIVPQSVVYEFGVHVSAPHVGAPLSVGPASLTVIGRHWLPTQLWPVGHPPQ
jgi:hypothetical protein